MPGPTELLIILVVCMLLFGANQVPKLARSLGQASREFRRGVDAIEQPPAPPERQDPA